MQKSDFYTLVPFVRSSEKEADSSFSYSKKVKPKKCTNIVAPVSNVRTFYESLVNPEGTVTAWNDSGLIQRGRNAVTSESIANNSRNDNNNNNNNNRNNICLESKLGHYSSAFTKSEIPCSTSTTLDKIPSTKDRNILQRPSNCKPVFCRNTDDIVKEFSHNRRQNLVLKCAQDGDVPGLKRHLQPGSGDIVNCTDSFGWTPLMCASFAGHTDVVEFLLSLDGINHRYRNRKGQSALGLSTKAGHWSIKKLLEAHHIRHHAPSSYHKKGNGQEKDISKNKQDAPSPFSTTEYFCDVCRMTVKNTTQVSHEASTVHLLSAHPHPMPESYFLSQQNRGFQIMVRKGWDESKGLGPTGEGRRIPIKTILKRDRKGIGAKSSRVARVTHFDACDAKSVTHKHQSCMLHDIKLNKKKLDSMKKREKIKERHLRRCLDF